MALYPQKTWWQTLTDPIANLANSAKAAVTTAMPGPAKALEPVISTGGANRLAVAMGGTRERKGYTCTGARMRKCVKTRRNKKKGGRYY
jgi:hypothetical protein